MLDILNQPASTTREDCQLSLFARSLFALGLGVVTGVGAVLFRDLINVLHNMFFNGRVALQYDANVFTAPSRWGPLIILAPATAAPATIRWMAGQVQTR